MPFFTPVGGGGLPKATVTGTTGSPNVNTTSRPGRTIYTFTGSGSITFGQAGSCEVFLAGGGGGTAGGSNNALPGAGAGGYVLNTSAVVPAGTFTVTVGAGGAGGVGGAPSFGCAGFPSSIHTLFTALGGGQGQANSNAMQVLSGGSGGGTFDNITGGAGLVGQGNNGGRSISGTGRPGGGGAGAAGADSNGTVNGRPGGAGLSNTITGSSVTYCGGGGGGAGNGGSGGAGGAGGGGAGAPANNSGNNGTANTGGGGGGYSDPGGFGPFNGGSGGSGVVIVVIG